MQQNSRLKKKLNVKTDSEPTAFIQIHFNSKS
jgi:hypothetical protein